MTKVKHVIYTAVANACTDILKLGEKPSIRNIHARIGGSYSTISTLFRQWKQAAHEAGSSELSFSDNLKNALMLEISHLTKAIKQQFENQLASDHQQAQESSQLLAEYEQQLGELKQQFVEQQSQVQSQKIDYEKQLAVSIEQAKAAQDTRLELQQ